MTTCIRSHHGARQLGWLPFGLALLGIVVASTEARAGNVLTPGTPVVDRPTLITLGVQLPITNDDDRDARVAVRYRQQGTTVWRNGPDLFRVHPEEVSGISLPQQFAGSIFNLKPATTYEIELTGTDPDGAVPAIGVITSTTRGVPPANPQNPVTVNVTNASGFYTALANAAPGQVITLAAGTYTATAGTPFKLDNKSGTATNPIIIRGAGQGSTIIDGNCGVSSSSCQNPPGIVNCIALDIHGSFVHVEDLTVRNATRGIWLRNITSPPNTATTRNVVRRVTMTNVCIGISSVSVSGANSQTDFYVCDNDLTGAVPDWPHVYADDGGLYADAFGIAVQGDGHVVCHNRIRRFGDAIRISPDDDRLTTRAFDIYGNDILTAYDNGIELDRGQGNVRAFRNRMLNQYAALSFQPIVGGPAYAFRNVLVNIAREQLKFATASSTDPSGILVYQNTFVSAPLIDSSFTQVALALNLINESNTSHNYLIKNNLFVGSGSVAPSGIRTASWKNGIDEGIFDYNGYYPNGGGNNLGFRYGGVGAPTYGTFAQLQAAGIEVNGRLVPQSVFANGLLAPTSYTTVVTAAGADVTLAAATSAIDTGMLLPNINDGYMGNNPDLGAVERDCPLPAPVYGPRNNGTDDSNEPIGCAGDVDGCRSNTPSSVCADDMNGCTSATCGGGICTNTCNQGAGCTVCTTPGTCVLNGSTCGCQ